ncbi:ATP-binding protein [Vibrio vulnificus]|nr:ATP-binding protein [Vibrio vulnificus]
MQLNIKISNLGKAKEAHLKLKPFTVIAGANSSGKSFVSRALYSFFSTMNQDHVTQNARKSVFHAKATMRSASYVLDTPSMAISHMHSQLTYEVEHLDSLINKIYGESSFTEQFSKNLVILEKLNSIELLRRELIQEASGKKKYKRYSDRISFLAQSLKNIRITIENPEKLFANSLRDSLDNSLKENFQVTNLSDLRTFGIDSDTIQLDFGETGTLNIKNETIDINFDVDGINEFQSLHNVVFIESPIYWKLRKPLKNAMEYSHIFSRAIRRSQSSDSLTGVPKYFYDLIELVEQNIKSSEDSQENHALYKNINEIIGGELDLSESGDIFFKDHNGGPVNINLTATGVTNLGLIALLLKRNVIAKGSYVFVDEPEVNLHPAWQKVMIETLYNLSLNGINVVVASHSIDMMKYIENIMYKLPDSITREHFAINRLCSNGISCSDDDCHPLQSLSSIKEDLGNPFFEMMLNNEW